MLPAAVKKQPVKGKPAGKAVQLSKNKEAPIVKAKPSKGPALSAAVKKQPAKSKPTGKAVQLSKKKETPVVKAKPSKGPVLPSTVNKQPVKSQPAGKAEKHVEKKAAPAAKEKTFETKVLSFEMDRLPEKKDVIVTEKIQTQKLMFSSVDLGKRYKCYKCGTKFYDLGKAQPLCPSCGANQLDGVIKAARKRRGKQRSAYVAKTEPLNIAPGENEDLHEVVDELDTEYVLDVDDIVLEENEDEHDKE
jgi:rubrerythrin